MKTVLVIEDDLALRENTAEILELSNYKVITASNGLKGVALAEKHQPDLIICDIMMPELDGYGVFDALSKKKSSKNIPFIFLSVKSETKNIKKRINLGADDYITKPFTDEDLISVVERRIERSYKTQNTETKSVASTERTRAQKPTGVGFATTPEQILAGRGGTQKGAATGINTLESTLTKAVQLRNRLNVLDAKGVDVSKLRATYEQANAAATQNQFGTSQRLLQNLARQVSLSENDLRVTKLREAAEKRRIKAATTATSAAGAPKPQGPFSPVGGLKTIPDSPAGIREQKRIDAAKAREAKAAERAAIAEERRAQQILEGITAGQPTRRITGPGAGTRKRFGDALSSGLIGGGFPLLFGQGPGAAAGGLVGGLGGGALGGGFGFGASIVGTILGSVVDEALNKGKALAAAFDDPIGKFSELQQAALLSSSAVEKNISALIEQGRNAEAAALIQLDIAQRFGDTGELDNLRNAYDELGRAFSQLSVITAKYVAGPLSDFISKLASSFQAFSSKELFNERLAGASTEVQTEARARVRSAAAELSGSGLSLAEVANKAYQEGLNLLDERLGKTREIQAAEQALALAKQRQNELDSLTTDQIKAQVQG